MKKFDEELDLLKDRITSLELLVKLDDRIKELQELKKILELKEFIRGKNEG